MNLHDLYAADGRPGLIHLAGVVGCNPKYLWQCATGRREPSPDLARKLVAADGRLTIQEIYAVGENTPCHREAA